MGDYYGLNTLYCKGIFSRVNRLILGDLNLSRR